VVLLLEEVLENVVTLATPVLQNLVFLLGALLFCPQLQSERINNLLSGFIQGADVVGNAVDLLCGKNVLERIKVPLLVALLLVVQLVLHEGEVKVQVLHWEQGVEAFLCV